MKALLFLLDFVCGEGLRCKYVQIFGNEMKLMRKKHEILWVHVVCYMLFISLLLGSECEEAAS